MSKTLIGHILPIYTEETEEIFDGNEVYRDEGLESTLLYEENQLFTSLIIGTYYFLFIAYLLLHRYYLKTKVLQSKD